MGKTIYEAYKKVSTVGIRKALATEFDYIQARLNADQILAEKLQQEEREQYSINLLCVNVECGILCVNVES
ncbi:hypothetical protein Tco_0541803, partial [Tanacetum coccineum]